MSFRGGKRGPGMFEGGEVARALLSFALGMSVSSHERSGPCLRPPNLGGIVVGCYCIRGGCVRGVIFL